MRVLVSDHAAVAMGTLDQAHRERVRKLLDGLQAGPRSLFEALPLVDSQPDTRLRLLPLGSFVELVLESPEPDSIIVQDVVGSHFLGSLNAVEIRTEWLRTERRGAQRAQTIQVLMLVVLGIGSSLLAVHALHATPLAGSLLGGGTQLLFLVPWLLYTRRRNAELAQATHEVNWELKALRERMDEMNPKNESVLEGWRKLELLRAGDDEDEGGTGSGDDPAV